MLDNSELLKLHTNQRLLIMEMQSRGINVDSIYKEIELIKELRKHIDIYVKLIENPKRTLELIEKKVR